MSGTTIETIVDDAGTPPPLPTKEPEVKADAIVPDTTEMDALKAKLAAYEAKETEAATKAEAARIASLSEAERFKEERQALDREKAALLSEAKKSAAERLGVQPKLVQLMPDVDPRTMDGARTLEQWAKDNPEFLKPKVVTHVDYTPPPNTALEDIMQGKKTHPLYTADGLRKLLVK